MDVILDVADNLLLDKAWAALLTHVAANSDNITQDIYSLWPTTDAVAAGDQLYWKNLPHQLLANNATNALWPVALATHDRPTYYPINSVLLAPRDTEQSLLQALSKTGVLVSLPPISVLSLVQSSEAYSSKIMSPSSVSQALKVRLSVVA